MREASLSKQQGEAQREQVAEEQWRKRREHWRTARKAVLLSTVKRRGQGLLLENFMAAVKRADQLLHSPETPNPTVCPHLLTHETQEGGFSTEKA